MGFEWNAEQEAYREGVLAFARRELTGDVAKRDHDGAFPLDAWKACARFGIQGLPVPEAYGGSDARPSTIVAAMEALGYGCADNGLLFSLNAQMWACTYPLVRFGNEEQKRRYLPGMCDGSLIAAHAMSEPGSGSDAFGLTTRAEPRGDGFVLHGSKTFVTNAPVADLFVVFARVGETKGFAGLTCFLIERGAAGLSVGAPIHKMGLRTSPMGELFFDGCEVPASQVLGRPTGGMRVFTAAMDHERALILACTVGTMERNLERCIAYAREREQFGRPISDFQAVSHRIVDMKLRLETSRLLLHRLGWLMDEGRPTALDSALAKLHLSESFVASSLDAVQVHGGYGYMCEYEVERDLRDAVGSRLYSGTSEIQKNLVARLLGL
jgi:alkylation response protein AidB-like acyl-CoA dehydrogenase